MDETYRTFDWPLQEMFSRISCDVNPIHTDAVAARRTHAGAPIVHGIHSLLWGLECYAGSDLLNRSARQLRVQFTRPIYVGERIRLRLSKGAGTDVRVRLSSGEEEVVGITIAAASRTKTLPAVPELLGEGRSPPPVPQSPGLREMRTLCGRLSLESPQSEVAALFPLATETFGVSAITSLLGCSCLVGMIVPGLHSMFSGMDVSLSGSPSTANDPLRYAVLSVTERFRLIRISVQSPGLLGSLETISRMPPVQQQRFNSMRERVRKGEFGEMRALIIGGSRGLGEVTAKLAAAGGAEVTITYCIGEGDAQLVAREINDGGATCRVIRYDATRPSAEQLCALHGVPTHLYYFATPHISGRRRSPFDEGRFSEFGAVYLKGFSDIVCSCARKAPQGIAIFYPSSVFIDDRPASMTEYTMSKAAGELLCADLVRFLPGIRIMTRRLPVLRTDQTSSVVQSEPVDPVDTMLAVLREMNGTGR